MPDNGGKYMKRQMLMLTVIIIIGIVIVFSPFFLENGGDKNAMNKKTLRDISSNLETIEDIEEIEVEFDEFDPQQVYFENIEELYNYFKFNQLEIIKERTTDYIHRYVSKDVLDCLVLTDTIKKENDFIEFQIEIKGFSNITISANINDIDIVKITNVIKK